MITSCSQHSNLHNFRYHLENKNIIVESLKIRGNNFLSKNQYMDFKEI